MKIKSYNEKFNIGEKIAIYPGSFDPFHEGHKTLIDRFLPLFDKIVIAVGINENKKGHFTIEERKKIIEKNYSGDSRIIVDSYEGWTVDYCVKIGAKYILRGMRNGEDFEFEKKVDHYNKNLNPNIETIYMIAGKEVENISSTMIRNSLK